MHKGDHHHDHSFFQSSESERDWRIVERGIEDSLRDFWLTCCSFASLLLHHQSTKPSKPSNTMSRVGALLVFLVMALVTLALATPVVRLERPEFVPEDEVRLTIESISRSRQVHDGWSVVGKPSRHAIITLTFALKQRNLDQLHTIFTEVSDPDHPNYGMPLLLPRLVWRHTRALAHPSTHTQASSGSRRRSTSSWHRRRPMCSSYRSGSRSDTASRRSTSS